MRQPANYHLAAPVPKEKQTVQHHTCVQPQLENRSYGASICNANIPTCHHCQQSKVNLSSKRQFLVNLLNTHNSFSVQNYQEQATSQQNYMYVTNLLSAIHQTIFNGCGLNFSTKVEILLIKVWDSKIFKIGWDVSPHPITQHYAQQGHKQYWCTQILDYLTDMRIRAHACIPLMAFLITGRIQGLGASNGPAHTPICHQLLVHVEGFEQGRPFGYGLSSRPRNITSFE